MTSGPAASDCTYAASRSFTTCASPVYAARCRGVLPPPTCAAAAPPDSCVKIVRIVRRGNTVTQASQDEMGLDEQHGLTLMRSYSKSESRDACGERGRTLMRLYSESRDACNKRERTQVGFAKVQLCLTATKYGLATARGQQWWR